MNVEDGSGVASLSGNYDGNLRNLDKDARRMVRQIGGGLGWSWWQWVSIFSFGVIIISIIIGAIVAG